MRNISLKEKERFLELATSRRDLTRMKTDIEKELQETREEFQNYILKYWDDPATREAVLLHNGEEVYICLSPGRTSIPMEKFIVQLAQRGVPILVIQDAQKAATTVGDSFPVMAGVRKKKAEAEEGGGEA